MLSMRKMVVEMYNIMLLLMSNNMPFVSFFDYNKLISNSITLLQLSVVYYEKLKPFPSIQHKSRVNCPSSFHYIIILNVLVET